MADVVFFEKPGCVNNTRQKQVLIRSGHRLEARNILAEDWTPDTLRPFFGRLAVSDWFNRAAPRVKSGEVVPASLDEAAALRLMCADPLLIRRPLIQSAGHRIVGWDEVYLATWIGLDPSGEIDEDCPQEVPCPSPPVDR